MNLPISKALKEIINTFRDNYIFVVGNLNFTQKNITLCKDVNDLKRKLQSFYNNLDKFKASKESIIACYKYTSELLDKLNFSLSHFGTTYLKEIVVQKFISPKQMLCTLSFTYELIASKYECEKNSIERDIRFAIKMAKKKTETKNQDISIFREGEPTVKQMVNYILDSFLITNIC